LRQGSGRTLGTWRPDLAQVSDLRRRLESRDVDWVLQRAAWLPRGDRDLLEAVYREGKPASEIARLGNQPVARVRTRLKQVLTRVCSEKLAFVVLHMDAWSPTRRRVAQRVVISGDSMREASERLGVSLYTVRRHAAAIDELFRNATDARRNARAG